MTPALARIDPPEQALPPVRLIRTIVRNPIEGWPRAVYEEPIYRSSLFGRERVFVMDPDLIGEILVDGADAFEKAAAARRSLEPILGQGLLTAEGPRWRWQRRAAAPIFRPDKAKA